MNSGKKYLGTKMNSNKEENVENIEETPDQPLGSSLVAQASPLLRSAPPANPLSQLLQPR